MKSNIDVIKILLEKRVKFSTVSGILSTKPNLIKWIDKSIPEIEIITTKSYQVKPNPGNREPIIYEKEIGSYGNAVGLKNPGMEAGYKELEKLKKHYSIRSLLNISISANNIEDFIKLIRKFEKLADLFELNFSCPHALDGYGASIGNNPAAVYDYIREIRKITEKPLFPKLTPNTDKIGEIALSAVRAGADGITAINTVGPEKFYEPVAGKPVLYNHDGHRGGKSGEWIKHIALMRIREIRQAIGRDVPIVGMGGISTAIDVKRMIKAGANAVGLGSVFARIPRQDLIPKFISSLKNDCLYNRNNASKFLASHKLMHYNSYAIERILTITSELKIFYLNGRINSKPGQFVFIFIPGSGEKPFTVVKDEPITFIIRKRGEFTGTMFNLSIGDRVLIRGIYGMSFPDCSTTTAYIIAGGTGAALVPGIAEKLSDQGKIVKIFLGFSNKEEAVIGNLLELPVGYTTVIDKGGKGEILRVLKERLANKNLREVCFYNTGPSEFVKAAMELEAKLGASLKEIYGSIETITMCGVGLCGNCEYGGKLLCKEGNFLSLNFLKDYIRE